MSTIVVVVVIVTDVAAAAVVVVTYSICKSLKHFDVLLIFDQ